MIFYRKRLLASTVTTILGSAALIAPQAASAVCTVAAGTVTCTGITTTTDTTYVAGPGANDRNYPVDTSLAPFTGTVAAGATVDGFGLAFSNTVGGANALNVVNSGAIQINAVGALAGGNAALDISAIGATPVNYSGTGTITNLSTTGSALSINSSGTGNLTANIGRQRRQCELRQLCG